jgi:hypothetical protein
MLSRKHKLAFDTERSDLFSCQLNLLNFFILIDVRKRAHFHRLISNNFDSNIGDFKLLRMPNMDESDNRTKEEDFIVQPKESSISLIF